MTRDLLTVRQVAELVGGSVEGDETVQIGGVAAVDSAGPLELTFAQDEKRCAMLADSGAAAALVGPTGAAVTCEMPLIRVDDVLSALSKVLGRFALPEDLPTVGVHPLAVVAPDAEVADDVAVGPGVVIGPRARIGRGSVLCANTCVSADVVLGEAVVLHEGVVIKSGCLLGDRVRIGPNSVIGYDGFGYCTVDGVHQHVPHVGNVVIEDDVEIGACACVDRAKFGTTRIGTGTKIDNLVQIAHSVQTGRGCLLASLVGIAGSTRLGDYVVLGGHVGVRDNITIGSGVQCAAYSAIPDDVSDGQKLFGIPAIAFRQKFREVALTARLPELYKRLSVLEKRLADLGSPEDH